MPTHSGNPFVNAGAIATVSLISGSTADQKWNKILDFYSKAAGEKLVLIDEVYKSEAATNTGNKALSYLLAKYDRIYADPFESVDVYTKQCSVGVNATQLARMGATLANNGVNPATGERVIKAEDIPHILSTMMEAGLYDGSGTWAWNVGLPAKSGGWRGMLDLLRQRCHCGVCSAAGSGGNSIKAQKSCRLPNQLVMFFFRLCRKKIFFVCLTTTYCCEEAVICLPNTGEGATIGLPVNSTTTTVLIVSGTCSGSWMLDLPFSGFNGQFFSWVGQ